MRRILAVAGACTALLLAAGAPALASPAGRAGTARTGPTTTAAAPYWGHWTTRAVVYDATGGNTYLKVAEAVSEWSRSGWNVTTTTDPARANITVSLAQTGSSDTIGNASLTVSGGVISACTVTIDPIMGTFPVGEHAALHELGHCGGLPHSTSARSVMYPTVGSNTMLTKPSSADLRWLAGNL